MELEIQNFNEIVDFYQEEVLTLNGIIIQDKIFKDLFSKYFFGKDFVSGDYIILNKHNNEVVKEHYHKKISIT